MTSVSSATGSSLTESVPDKVVLVGDVGVGKTSIFLRFKTGKFRETTPSHNPRDGEYQKEWQVAGSTVSVSGAFARWYMSSIDHTSSICSTDEECMCIYIYMHTCSYIIIHVAVIVLTEPSNVYYAVTICL